MPSFRPDDSVRFSNPIAWLINQIMTWGLENLFKRFYGTYAGIVIDTQDPKGLGRIRAKCPAIGMDTDESVPADFWAWPCLPGVGIDLDTGQMSGTWMPPVVGSSVWLQFEAGNSSNPIWMGGWVPESRVMPELRPDQAEVRGIRTKAGHYLRFSDASDDVHITLAKGDGAGSQSPSYLTLDTDGNVVIANDNGSLIAMSAIDDELNIILGKENPSTGQVETLSMVSLQDDAVVVSTKSNGAFVSLQGKDVTINGGTVTINAEKFLVNSESVYLAKNASEPAVKGMKLMQNMALHIHNASAPFSPVTPPTTPPLILGNELSTKVFIG